MRILFPDGSIGQRIRQERTEQQITAEALATAAGCPLLTLLRIEAGSLLELDHMVFSRLCAALNVPPEILTKRC